MHLNVKLLMGDSKIIYKSYFLSIHNPRLKRERHTHIADKREKVLIQDLRF